LQALVSCVMALNQDDPRPGLMKTLAASSGSDATLAQKVPHVPAV
jgi:hypothetical protein